MTLATFPWTDRCRPVVELGIGDTRTPTGQAVWGTARWNDPTALWAGTEPTWFDITCDAYSYSCEYGRIRVTDRFVAGQATVLVDNSTGWADPHVVADPNVLTVRPGRAIRMGIVHQVHGIRWLFRGFVDNVVPVYDPTLTDTVQLDCIDALGEVNRAKFAPVPLIGDGDTITTRITRILDAAKWPATKRDLSPTADRVIADDLAGQAADLLAQAADSGGGSVFGDYEGRIAFRPRDWQTFTPGTPPEATIGNIDAGDVCPTRWERPFNRADIATRVIMGRQGDPASVVQLDDAEGQVLYGIEPFQRTDLLTAFNGMLEMLARRYLRTRNHTTSPRVRSVTLDAATADNALDLMTSVDVYKPSRYRCRLEYDRGMVFDAEMFATGVAHDVTPTNWTMQLNLDAAAPFAVTGERWDSGHWNTTRWTAPVTELVTEARELMEALR